MSRSISTLVLMGISALILLFILSSFYRVFNREPIHAQAPNLEAEQSETQSSQAVTPTLPLETDSSVAATENDTDSGSVDIADMVRGEPTELVDNETETETAIEEAEIEVVGSPGDILHERPHLQNALPPIPQAPPSPSGPPVVTAPSEESFSQTGSTNQSAFPPPIVTTPVPTNSGSPSSFPAPVAPSVNPAPAPSPTPSTPSSSAFPAPIIINSGTTSSGSFPRPQ